MNSKCNEGIHNPVLAGGVPVCADCGFSLQPPPTEPERSVCSDEARGCASPYEKLKLTYLEKQLTICDQMLTEQGVPEWVMLSDSNGVPANSVPFRLKWYLARRKDVAEGEIDQQLQDMMEENLKLARARHNGLHERPGANT